MPLHSQDIRVSLAFDCLYNSVRGPRAYAESFARLFYGLVMGAVHSYA